MALSLAGPAVSFTNAVLSYFSPSKSPFYSIVAFGCAAGLLTGSQVSDQYWLFLVIPIVAAIGVSLGLALRMASFSTPEEHEEQARFARSLSISSALLILALVARSVDQVAWVFWMLYAACISQVLTFFLYVIVRSRSRDPSGQMNFVQFALITTTLLSAGSIALHQYVDCKADEEMIVYANNFKTWAFLFYGFWFICICKWLSYIVPLFSIPHDPPAAERQ
jgi:hypothetical protein